MKFKNFIMLGFLLIGLMFVLPQSALAEEAYTGWALVEIEEIGPSTAAGGLIGGLFTHIHNNPVFNRQYLIFADSVKKEMLAVALTAMSLGKNVQIRIQANGLTIDRILLAK
jgi:hypothetical protein